MKKGKNCNSSRLHWEEAEAPKGAAAHSLGTTCPVSYYVCLLIFCGNKNLLNSKSIKCTAYSYALAIDYILQQRMLYFNVEHSIPI